jgi:homoserine O-acetyltransferase
MTRVVVPNLTIGIDSDMLYPEYQQIHMNELLSRTGAPNEYVQIKSPHGHDAFLIHFEEVGAPIGRFLARLD